MCWRSYTLLQNCEKKGDGGISFASGHAYPVSWLGDSMAALHNDEDAAEGKEGFGRRAACERVLATQ